MLVKRTLPLFMCAALVGLGACTAADQTAGQALDDMYLTILSRHPTREETDAVQHYIESSGLSRRDAAIDVIWALLNTSEFIYRH